MNREREIIDNSVLALEIMLKGINRSNKWKRTLLVWNDYFDNKKR